MSLLPDNQTVAELLLLGRQQLQQHSSSPALDAELLLAAVLNCTKLDLHKFPELVLEAEQIKNFSSHLARRINQEPIAYIIGYKEFYGRQFSVNSSVLCPRPETELLIELALKNASDHYSILDLGTGSGCIAITLALELAQQGKSYRIVAVDKSEAALKVAKFNSQKLQAKHIDFIASDWFANINKDDKYNLIISNPPYVASTAQDCSPELKHEPELALYASDNGMAEIKNILNNVFDFLDQPGIFLCEIGTGQGSELQDYIARLATSRKLSAVSQIVLDLAGRERVLRGELSDAHVAN